MYLPNSPPPHPSPFGPTAGAAPESSEQHGQGSNSPYARITRTRRWKRRRPGDAADDSTRVLRETMPIVAGYRAAP
ncbi:hypothetical protein ACFYPN_22720 [Streptomyces sp. NPDC005576]|uniref:hypothetical protein n=1 Tax=Streptomyces sp. NPDC005576 TaxID=3364726 RepID=UPI0036C04F56